MSLPGHVAEDLQLRLGDLARAPRQAGVLGELGAMTCLVLVAVGVPVSLVQPLVVAQAGLVERVIGRHGHGQDSRSPCRCAPCARAISAARPCDRHDLLRAGWKVAHLDLAGEQFVADDDGEVGVLPGRGLELLAELAMAELRSRRDAGRSKVGRDAQAIRRRRRVGPDHDRHDVRLALHDPGRLEGQDDAIEPHSEPDTRGGPSAEQLDEAVVAAATAERLLLAVTAWQVELEGGPGVVVETAHQGGFEPVRHAERSQVLLDRGEVVRAGGAQVVRDPRCAPIEIGHRGILGIQQTEHVTFQAVPLESREPVPVRAEVVGQQREVGGAAGRVPDRVEQHLGARQAGVAVEADPELDDLGIDGRPGIADRLDVELPELAVAPRLRSVVAEHRTDLTELHRLRPGLHPVLDVGADDAGRRFGPERERLGLLRALARAGTAPSRRCR